MCVFRTVFLVVLATVLGFTVQVAPIDTLLHDESLHGDLRWINDMPTQFALTEGRNRIIGAVQDVVDVWDPFGFSVPSGQQLDNVILVSLERTFAISFFADPDALSNYVGGFNPQPTHVGMDLLQLGGLSPLPAGAYSARVFTSRPTVQPYHFDLQVSPAEPVPISESPLYFEMLVQVLGAFVLLRRFGWPSPSRLPT